MILPTKHVRPDRSLIGVGGEVLKFLDEPTTVSNLWDEIRARRSAQSSNAPISYNWFVLSLDFLFAIGAIEVRRGLLQRVQA